MSELSYLEKLLDGIAVEWKALSDVVHMRAGQHISASNIKEEANNAHPYPCFGGNGIRGFVAKNSHDGRHLLIGRQGALCGNVQRTSGKFYATEHAVVVTPKNCINVDWAFHLLTLMNLNQYASQSAQPGLAVGKIESLKIPIPCPDNPEKSLAIQSEIVRILDTFTALTAELTAELTLRKKQYNYYRDQLLSFDEGETEWVTLSVLAENLDSKRKPITSGLRDAGNIPYYGASGIVDYVKDYIFDGDFLLVSEDGANLLARNTPIAFSISGKTWVNNHAHVLKFDTYAERRYVEYYLNSIDLTTYISGAAQPKLNKKNLESIRVPNPSLKEKERIVSILDKFDALTNSITEGLPREIELRQKQYEYYRDMLFSFPKQDMAEA
ncbi:Type I restriction-modification system, specificity subunit S [Lelliottia jeotgali]|nr:Type I restriction-modification system, specificity subunit S [Lelliottia jeotgali]